MRSSPTPAKVGVLLTWLALSACAPIAAMSPTESARSATSTLSPALRQDIDREWVSSNGQVRWPPNEGFATAPVLVVLPPGTLLDRFGSQNGRFFSPRGARYPARALPYECRTLAYTEYRVVRPLPAWGGKAATWFNEPGGAMQFETDAPAASLEADGTLEVVPLRGSDQPC